MDRDFDVYVDSPLAIEATEVFSKNVEQCFDEDAIELVRQGINPLSFPAVPVRNLQWQVRDWRIPSCSLPFGEFL